jgi:voltage-gated potassium channel
MVMPRPRRQGFNGTTVLRLAATVTAFAAVVVLTGGSALWLVEREQPDSTVHSYGDALWWALTTLTTTGYGDYIPMTTMGRVIGAGVMVTGVAVIGAVAAVIALALTVRFARQEELAVKAEAESLEHRLEIRLARIETQLDGLDTRLQARSSAPIDDAADNEADFGST